jgi:hypothetical protein
MPPQNPVNDLTFLTAGLTSLRFWYRLLLWMLVCEFLLVILNIWTPEILARTVCLDGESNFVVWFSSSQLLLASLTALLLVKYEETFRAKLPWLLLSALLPYLSVDETAMLHECISTRLALAAGSQISETHWLKQALPLVIGVIVFLSWLAFHGFRNNRPAQRLMVIAVICWSLSMIFEGIQRNIDSTPIICSLPNGYKATWIIEEFNEMAGASFLWSALGLRLCAESHRDQ